MASGIDAGVSHPWGSSDFLSTPLPEFWDPLAGFTWEGQIEPASNGISYLAYEPESLSSAQSSSPPAFEATNREARKLLGDCLDVQIDPDNPEYVSQISSHLDDLGVRRSGGELVQHTKTLSSGASAGDMGLCLLRYAIYLTSNNLLCLSKVDKILKWIIRSGAFSTVERLIDTKTPSVKIFAAKLLVSAARLGKIDVARALTKKGIDINSFAVAWGLKTTALEEAVQKRNAVLVRLLLDAGANPNTYDDSCVPGRTALQTAITGPSRSLEIAEMLIGCGADVNTHTFHCDESWTLLNEAVSEGNIDAVRVLLAAGARVNDAQDQTALQIAALRDDVEMVQVLLDAGADVNSPAGKAYADNRRKAAGKGRYRVFQTPLQRAVSQNNIEISQILLEAGADINGFPAAGYVKWKSLVGSDEGCLSDLTDVVICGGDDDDGVHYKEDEEDRRMCTPLQEAVLEKNSVLVRLLLSLGADVNAVGSCGTALQIAARETEGCKLARLLLSKGADVNSPAQVPWSKTALQAAARSGNEEMVELLLNQGANVNAAPSRCGGRTALQAATESGKIGLVELLVNSGADVNANAAFKEGLTCLQAAAETGDIELLNYLLRSGADVNSPASAKSGRTALQVAVECDHSAIVERLLEAGADIRACPSWEDGLQPLCAALSNESYDLAQLLLNKGADPNENCDHSNPLKIAVGHGAVEMVRSLILAGANVNKRPVHGWTAIETAAGDDSAKLVSILIDGGVTLDGIDGTRALERAVENNSIDVVKLLLAKGASPNKPPAANVNGESALQRAVTRWAINDDMLRLLLHHGADVKADGGSCLQTAARNGCRRAVEILLAAGADVNFPPSKICKTTALQGAILSKNIDVVHLLLDAGADINGPPAEVRGMTALQAAVRIRDKRMVRFLLSRGADVNGPPSKSYGATALQRAVIDGSFGIALVLLKAGAGINAPAAVQGGRTALDAAAEHGRLDLACLLLRNEDDTDAEAVQMRCKRAAKLASSNGHTVLAKILRGWKKSAESAEAKT